MRSRFHSHKCQDVKPWVIAAIKDEEQYLPDQMWKKEPSAEHVYEERLRRMKFLLKYSKTLPDALILAERLESCESEHRCLSGACPECERLVQRWFVRRSGKFIARQIGQKRTRARRYHHRAARRNNSARTTKLLQYRQFAASIKTCTQESQHTPRLGRH